MKTKRLLLTACLDANVIISAVAFGGKPLKVLQRALIREFNLVMGTNIFSEVQRNLTGKLGLKDNLVDAVLRDLWEVSSVYVPSGDFKYIEYAPDSLVLEVAIVGGCEVLVTGDREHLLPLSPFRGIIIEPPSKFLNRLDAMKE